MTVRVFPTTDEPLTSLWVGSHRFLFSLHTPEQQVMMDAIHSAALQLTPSQILDTDPMATDAHGWPLAVLRVFRIAYEQMDKLGGQVDLLSAPMDLFLQAAAAVGIYGNGEEIPAEIARVKSNTPPE